MDKDLLMRSFVAAMLVALLAAGLARAQDTAPFIEESFDTVDRWQQTDIKGTLRSVPSDDNAGRWAQTTNVLATASLERPVTGSFTLRIKILHRSWKRLGMVWLTDAKGEKGYGFYWLSGEQDKNNGEGFVAISKLDIQEPLKWANWGKEGRLTPISGSRSPYATSGRKAVGAGPAEIMLVRDAESGRTGLWVDDQLRLIVQDKAFNEFHRVYLRGNEPMVFDDLVIRPAAPEEIKRLSDAAAL